MTKNSLQFCADRVAPEKLDILNSLPHKLYQELLTGDSVMKRIKLTKGQYAIVDDADFEWLNQWKWYVGKGRCTFYAHRSSKVNEQWETVYMHRFIVGLTKGDGREVDHEGGNGLDNRRENLRICTHSENMQNRQTIKKGKSCKYQGVCKIRSGKWYAYIMKNYRHYSLGEHVTAKAAAQAYDRKALELYGPDAKTNFPKEGYLE